MPRLLDLGLDFDQGVLRGDDREIPLSPLLSRLLAYLVENRGRLVPKDELLEAVWRDSHVTDASLYQALHNLRRALGANPVRNVRGRGYELDLRVDGVDPPPDPHRLPLLGREAEMQRLNDTFSRVREGRGRLVLISGSPGIGKTRLIEEAVELARRRGFSACRAGSPRDPFEQTLWPWEQVLGDLVRGDRSLMAELLPAQRRAVEQAFPFLAPRGLPSQDLDPAAARLRLFESVAKLLEEKARHRPLLLAFDDLHRADVMSLALLEWVAARVSDLRIAILAATRSTGSDPAAEVVGGVSRLLATSNAASEQLAPLSRADVADAVRAVRRAEYAPEVVDVAYARCGGNPLFLRALLLSADSIAAPLSSELGALVSSHLSVLARSSYELLRKSSVLGLEFDPALARELCEVNDATWQRAVADALGHGLLQRRAGALAFVHALVWEALQKDAETNERRSGHARVFALLRQRNDLGDGALEVLAEHAVRAVPEIDGEMAIRCCVTAAEAAEQRLAFESAERLYRRALSLARESAPDARLALMVALAETRARLGDAQGIEELLESTIALSREVGDHEAHARIVLALAPFRDDANDPDLAAIATLEVALAAHREPTSRRAQLLSRLAHMRWYLEPPEARRLAGEALALAERVAEPGPLVDVLIRVHRVLQTGVGDEAIRNAVLRRLEESIERTPDPLLVVEGLQTLAWEALIRGDRGEFDLWSERIQRQAREAEAPHVRWWALIARAAREHLDGRLDEAERRVLEGFELARRTRQPLGEPAFLLQMLSIRRDQGRLSELEPRLAAVIHALPARLPWRIAWNLAGLAGGKPGPAREMLRTLTATEFEPLGLDVSYGPALVMLAEIAIALDDRAAAERIRERLVAMPERNVVVAPGFFHWGSVAHWIGGLSEVLGEAVQAERWYAAGVERDRRLGALAFVARGQLALARILDASAGPDDVARRERIASFVEEGTALARSLGLEAVTASRPVAPG